jgi:hypothetical protein
MCSTGDMKNTYEILVRNYQSKRPHERHKRKEKDNMYVGDTGCEGVKSILNRLSRHNGKSEGFHRSRIFLDQLSNYQLYKKIFNGVSYVVCTGERKTKLVRT